MWKHSLQRNWRELMMDVKVLFWSPCYRNCYCRSSILYYLYYPVRYRILGTIHRYLILFRSTNQVVYLQFVLPTMCLQFVVYYNLRYTQIYVHKLTQTTSSTTNLCVHATLTVRSDSGRYGIFLLLSILRTSVKPSLQGLTYGPRAGCLPDVKIRLLSDLTEQDFSVAAATPVVCPYYP